MGSDATFEFKNGKKKFDLEGQLKKLASKSPAYAKVGFPSSLNNTYPDGTPIVKVAIWNEFGTDKAPARPFMQQTSYQRKGSVSQFYKKINVKILSGKADAETQLNYLAIKYKSWIQETITRFDDPPNAPATIAAKGYDNPLIDTGLMRQAVTYEITKGK